MVFQGFHLFPHKTVAENIMEGPVTVLKQSKKEARDKALSLLEKVGLSEKPIAILMSFPEDNNSVLQ